MRVLLLELLQGQGRHLLPGLISLRVSDERDPRAKIG